MTRTRVTSTSLLAIACLLALGTANSARADDDARAAELYQLCGVCHGANGEGSELALAPAIAGMAEWYVKGQLDKFRGGLRGTHFDDIAGMRMRPMSLSLRSDEDVELIAGYVARMQPTTPAPTIEGGDAAKGETLYAPCTACHGAKGEGNPALFGPPVTHINDWYLLRQLENFRAGVRGTNPADQFGVMMRPMALSLPDEQALRDVVAYMLTLGESE